jgi:hypothetical protein
MADTAKQDINQNIISPERSALKIPRLKRGSG